MIPKRPFLLLIISIAVRSEQPESLRLNVPLWDVGDLYSRISNAFGAASSTPAPQSANSGGAAPWSDYYNVLLQEYYNKKQGLYAANSASEVIPVEPVPLPIPVPVPLPRPPRPLRPLRPQRPTRPWPTRKPTRRSTTTRRPTTTTIRTTTTRTTTTTASPISSSSSSSSTATPIVPTTTEAINSTTIEPTSNSTASESSTTGGSSTTGSFPTSTIIASSKYLPISTPKINMQTTTANPLYSPQSQFQHTPTVLSLEGSSPGQLRPEQELTVQSPPQSMTSLCHNYPRLCAKPEEAQYVRLTDGFGKPMLLILPGAVEEHPLPIVRPMTTMERPFRSQPYRRKNPSRNRYVYRLIKKRNKQRL